MPEMYIGVMSGTSLDGIDLVAVSFEPPVSRVRLKLHACLSVSFPPELRTDLLALTQSGDNEIERMGRAEVAYAKVVAAAVLQMIHDNNLNKTQILAIGCHGQTIRHRPEAGFSLQIGDPNLIAERTGITVVADFRRRDLAAGGQGAPLVPAFHEAAFRDRDGEHDRIVLNLGGIANITVLPRSSWYPDMVTHGFDTGPANLLMDAWCSLQTGQSYDADGAWGASGKVHQDLLTQLLTHPYFAKLPPKSTGREDFNLAWLQQQLMGFTQVSAVDVQATLQALTVQSVIKAIKQTGLKYGQLVVCGGGALNSALYKLLANTSSGWIVMRSTQLGIAPTWVEAAAFAWLAQQRLQMQAGNLPRVTGAQGGRVLGAIYPA